MKRIKNLIEVPGGFTDRKEILYDENNSCVVQFAYCAPTGAYGIVWLILERGDAPPNSIKTLRALRNHKAVL